VAGFDWRGDGRFVGRRTREAVSLKDTLQRFPGDGVILVIGENQRQIGPLSSDESWALKG